MRAKIRNFMFTWSSYDIPIVSTRDEVRKENQQNGGIELPNLNHSTKTALYN